LPRDDQDEGGAGVREPRPSKPNAPMAGAVAIDPPSEDEDAEAVGEEIVQPADQASRVEGRAARRVRSFEQDDVAPAELRQPVEDGATAGPPPMMTYI
jgi:hypothetical protein